MLQTTKKYFQDLRNFWDICSGFASKSFSTKKIHEQEDAVNVNFAVKLGHDYMGFVIYCYNFRFKIY